MDYKQRYYQLLLDLVNNYDRETPAKIRQLRSHQIFVFGTDNKGTQRYGAAGFAAKYCGAVIGVSEGLRGTSYAIPSVGCSFEYMAAAISRFIAHAKNDYDHIFMVTAIGCGHAGYSATDVAPLFLDCLPLRNVWLPSDFIREYRIAAIHALGLKNAKNYEEKTHDIKSYYDERVHSVVKYLLDNNIEINPEGGFTLTDDNDIVIAEAELGIESEKVVFYPFNSPSAITFQNEGYTICEPEEYLKSKGQI